MQETIKVKIDDLVFDCLTDGDKEDELIIFLHGWPESACMWSRLMADFARKGFYCVAPNLRGFSKGACPQGKKNYTLDKLVKDVVDISRFFGQPKFHLVGHDWGAVIGWKVVHDYKKAMLSWTALSVPHFQAFGKAIVVDQEQRKMSQYIKNFQWPYFPERRLRKDDFKIFRKLWQNSKAKEIDEYLSIFRNPKQLSASLNYYRGNYRLLRKAAKGQILGDITAPTLFIWGKNDPAIGSYSVETGHQYMKGEYEFIPLDAGHWLIQTHYSEVQAAITQHIIKNKG